MADSVMVKVAGADGKETEVAVPMSAIMDAVKDTHVPKDRIESDINRRVQGIVKNQGLRKPEELLDDETFVAQVLEKHGGKPKGGDDEASKQLKDALAKARKDFEDKELGPVKARLQEKEDREQALLVRDLERQILQAAADSGVLRSLLKAPARGKPAPIVSMLEDTFAYDAETGEFYVADGDSFVLSTSADKSTTYKGVDEYVKEWASQKENADFLQPGQRGPGMGGQGDRGGPRGGTGSVVLTPEEAGNYATYQDALKRVGGDHSKIIVRAAGSAV